MLTIDYSPDKTISPPVRGLDELRRVHGITEHFPQLAYAGLEDRIPHHRVWPDRGQQLLFTDQAARMLHQVVQHGKRLGCEGQDVRPPPHTGVDGVEVKRTKIHRVVHCHCLPPLLRLVPYSYQNLTEILPLSQVSCCSSAYILHHRTTQMSK